MVWRDRGKEEKQARLARKEARTRRKGKDHKKSLLAPNVLLTYPDYLACSEWMYHFVEGYLKKSYSAMFVTQRK